MLATTLPSIQSDNGEHIFLATVDLQKLSRIVDRMVAPQLKFPTDSHHAMVEQASDHLWLKHSRMCHSDVSYAMPNNWTS